MSDHNNTRQHVLRCLGWATASTLITSPFERISAVQQWLASSLGKPQNAFQAAKTIFQLEDVSGFWRGVPFGIVSIFIRMLAETSLARGAQSPSAPSGGEASLGMQQAFLQTFLASSVSSSLLLAVVYPATVLRNVSMLQAPYIEELRARKTLLGKLKLLYSGLPTAMLCHGVSMGFYVATHKVILVAGLDRLKERSAETPDSIVKLYSAAIAVLFTVGCKALIYPLDVGIRRQLASSAFRSASRSSRAEPPLSFTTAGLFAHVVGSTLNGVFAHWLHARIVRKER